MKNQRGIIWAPVLIMISTVLVAGFATYMLFQAGKTNQAENENANVALVNQANNNTSVNTNTIANTNSVSNTNSASALTSGWKTYASKQYGLNFKYPTNWEVEEGLLNSPYSVFAHPKSAPETPTLRFWLDSAHDGMQTPSGAKTSNTSIAYANRPAKLSKTATSSGELLIAHIQFDVTPIGWGTNSTISIFPNDAGSIDIPLQIMGTLSITDPTAGWKTYTDSANGFSFKYPRDLSPEQPHNNIISFFNSAQDKSISILIKDSPFSANGITRPDATGNEIVVPSTELTTVTVGDQDGYRFRSGVLSCSSTQIWTALGTSKTLVTSFQRCEDGTNALELDYSTQNQILSTFQFTK